MVIGRRLRGSERGPVRKRMGFGGEGTSGDDEEVGGGSRRD